MTTKIKAQPLPLSRRERRTLAEARHYGLMSFAYPDRNPINGKVARMVRHLTDPERIAFFDGLEVFVDLTMALRTEN